METSPTDDTAQAGTRTLAITSGKGGVGKSSITVNLGIALAKTGWRVCLFDADTGLANINILLGLHPEWTIEHVLTGEKHLADIMLQGPHGIQIIPSASGIAEVADMPNSRRSQVLDEIRELEHHFDYFIIDTAGGINSTVLDFIGAADQTLVVITPEPTSLTDAFSLLKVLKNRDHAAPLLTLVNMCRGASQAREIFNRFNGAVHKYLGLGINYLGFLHSDESMRAAVQLQQPVTLYPDSDPSSGCFTRLAEQLHACWETGKGSALSDYWQTTRGSDGSPSAFGPVPTEASDAPPATNATDDRMPTDGTNDVPPGPPDDPQVIVSQISGALATGHWSSDELRQLMEGLGELSVQHSPVDTRRGAAQTSVAATPRGEPDPISADPPTEGTPDTAEPEHDGTRRCYDYQRFGSQEALVRWLRDKPRDVALHEWLQRRGQS